MQRVSVVRQILKAAVVLLLCLVNVVLEMIHDSVIADVWQSRGC